MDQKICQSCGMPMNLDSDFGTDGNGAKVEDYCTYCFQNGNFTSGDVTVGEFAIKMVELMKNMPEAPQMTLDEATAMLKNLKRWK